MPAAACQLPSGIAVVLPSDGAARCRRVLRRGDPAEVVALDPEAFPQRGSVSPRVVVNCSPPRRYRPVPSAQFSPVVDMQRHQAAQFFYHDSIGYR